MVKKNIRLKTHLGNGVYGTLHPETNSGIVRVGDKNLDETLGDVSAQLAQTVDEVNRATSELTVDSEVIFARGGKTTLGVRINEIEEDCNQNFSTYNGRITKLEINHDVIVENKFKNADFKNTTEWTTNVTTKTVSNNEMILTPTSLASSIGVYQATNIPVGNKIYFSFEYFVKYANTFTVGISGSLTETFTAIPNTWTRKSSTTIGYMGFATSLIVFYHNFSSNYVLSDTISIRRALALDLTTIFGTGNEPTQTQMDRLLAQFPNSWFDGTVNIYNSKHMMSMLFKELTKMNNAITALGGNV